MKLIKRSFKVLAAAVFAAAFCLTPAEAGANTTDTIAVEGKNIVITLPEGFGKASSKLAAAIEKLVSFEDFKPEVWSYTRKAVEDDMASSDGSKQIGEYLGIMYKADSSAAKYSAADFARDKDAFDAGRKVSGTDTASLEAQLSAPCPPETPLKAIAPEREADNYSFWLSAVDAQVSKPEDRKIMLTMEGLFFKDGLPFSASIFRYYESPQDLVQIRKDLDEFIKLNLK